MSFLYHIFGIIFYIIWSIIGAAILVVMVLLFMFKPWNAMSGGVGLGSLTSMMGQVGGVGDLIKNIQNQGGIKESYGNLPKTTQDCLKKQLGEQKLNDLLAGKTQLNSTVMMQAVQCLR